MKNTLIIGAIAVLVLIIGFVLWKPSAPVQAPLTEMPPVEDVQEGEVATNVPDMSVVPLGTYTIRSEESVVGWAGKKPLIDGYVNDGSIAVTSGEVVIGETGVTGTITLDMNTLSVSGTPAKPGQESALEGHLKGERWFDVATYPTAVVALKSIVARPDVASSGEYDVVADLTMHGVTEEVQFVAQITHDAEMRRITAQADFEIDRTKWGVTAGSGSFFDNLEDNVVDDMVALSFTLVADAQ
jgi:polyisoprenoid-binding protein YceI